MADDVDVTPGSGKTVAATEIGGKQYQRVLIANSSTGAALDTSLPGEVVGSVAHDGVDAGNPVKIAGVYKSLVPAAVAAGDRAELITDQYGTLLVKIFGDNGAGGLTTIRGAAFGPRAVASNTTGLWVFSAPQIYNGTTYDAETKPNAASRIASAAASVNATSAKGSAGEVFRIMGNNVKASVVYLKIYNKATAPTVGTDTPVLTVPIPASAVFNIDVGGATGFYLGTGIAYGFTTDAADNGTTALSAGDILDFCLTYS
jgi:hypothetical protein